MGFRNCACYSGCQCVTEVFTRAGIEAIVPYELYGSTLVERSLSSRTGFKRGNMSLLEAITEKDKNLTRNKGLFFTPGSSAPAKHYNLASGHQL